jgi:hypothetical protein
VEGLPGPHWQAMSDSLADLVTDDGVDSVRNLHRVAREWILVVSLPKAYVKHGVWRLW